MFVLPELNDKEEVKQIAKRIVSLLQQPFHPQGYTCQIGSSIGISLFSKDGDTAETLIKNADIAMYAVKADGRNHFRFFEPEMADKAQSGR